MFMAKVPVTAEMKFKLLIFSLFQDLIAILELVISYMNDYYLWSANINYWGKTAEQKSAECWSSASAGEIWKSWFFW